MNFYTFNYELKNDFFKTLDNTEVEFNIHSINSQENKKLKPSLHVDEFFELFPMLDMIDSISEGMMSQGIGHFGFFNKVPSLVKRINFKILEYETDNNQDRYSIVVPLAPILGLPGIKEDREELVELKELFTFFKQEQLKHVTQDFVLQIHRGFGKTGVTIHCDNELIEQKINTTFQNKVNNSPVLTAWQNNLLMGIDNTDKQCDNLFCNTKFISLLTMEEYMAFNKDEEQALKEEKYQSQIKKHQTKNKSFF